MKIGLAILNAEPGRGGAERYTQDLAASLVARGNDVYLLAARFSRDVEPARQVRLDGMAGGRVARYLAYQASLVEHLKTERYDIVHAMLPVRGCDLYHPHAGIEAHNLQNGHLRHGSPVRQVISRLTNQLNRKRRVYAKTEGDLLEEDRSAVLCLSRAMQQIAEEHYDLKDGQSFVLINGVDLGKYDPSARPGIREEMRRKLGIEPGEVAALMVSNNFRLKGLKQAIQALHGLGPKGKRAKLVVVGREAVQGYRRLANQFDVEEQVVFAGPTDDPQSFYAASDFFVLPTAYDSCSLVVLEAMAMGKPVITTRRNGACEAMVDGVHGFVIDDQADMEGLCEAWGEMLDDGLRGKMSEAALGLRPELSKDRHVDRLLEVYAKVREAK
jgi:UDP-glucose:(heptosyl)LPS alpha-1,3-glucosyltransferase